LSGSCGVTVDALVGRSVEARCAGAPVGPGTGASAEEGAVAAGFEMSGNPVEEAGSPESEDPAVSKLGGLFSLMTVGQARRARERMKRKPIIRQPAMPRKPAKQFDCPHARRCATLSLTP
jgi:hypothetical protein